MVDQSQIDNERLAAAVTPYGVGTRSYNRSAEKREMDRQRAAATKCYQPQPVEILLCHCRSFRYSHDPADHRRLRGDWDWRTYRERGV